MKRKIVVTGATGLIGLSISKKLIARGDEVIVFTRNPVKAKEKLPGAFDYVGWEYDKVSSQCRESLSEADAVIHLAGESIMSSRWNDEHKKSVYDSRIIGTRNIVNAIKENVKKPSVFICASAIGYYDNDINKVFNEDDKPGSGFLQQVVVDWEKEAAAVESSGVRRVSIRIGIVLDKREGALAQMLLPYKFFVGGPLGSGKQWLPWVHILDISNLFIYALDNNLAGPYNGVGGNATMDEFAETLGKVIKRPSLFRAPSFILKIILGEAADAVLKGSKIIPLKTLEAGFEFRYDNLETAFKEIFDYSNQETIS